MRELSKTRTRVQLSVGLVVGMLLAVLSSSVTAGADGLRRSFSAVAEASGMYVTYGIPGFLIVDNYLDGGGPVAHSELSSDLNSKAFASLPYPGSTAVGYPGLAAFALGSAPPGYPLYASASHPTSPEQKVEDPSGTYLLSAKAGSSNVSGDAQLLGPAQEPVSGTRASSKVETNERVIVASALSEAKALLVGPLSVGLVRSESTTSYEQGAKSSQVTKSSLTVEGGRVGDATFTFGQDGLNVATHGAPVPVGQGLTVLNQALAPSGLSIQFHEAAAVPGGGQAATFEVTSLADVPGAGKGKFRLTLGGAKSGILLGADPSAPVIDETTAPDNAAASIDEPAVAESTPFRPSPSSPLSGAFSLQPPASSWADSPSGGEAQLRDRDATPPTHNEAVGQPAETPTALTPATGSSPVDPQLHTSVRDSTHSALPAAQSAPRTARSLSDLAGLLVIGALVTVGMVARWRLAKARER